MTGEAAGQTRGARLLRGTGGQAHMRSRADGSIAICDGGAGVVLLLRRTAVTDKFGGLGASVMTEILTPTGIYSNTYYSTPD